METEQEIAADLLKRLESIYEGLGAAGNYSHPPSDPAGRPELQGGIWGMVGVRTNELIEKLSPSSNSSFIW